MKVQCSEVAVIAAEEATTAGFLYEDRLELLSARDNTGAPTDDTSIPPRGIDHELRGAVPRAFHVERSALLSSRGLADAPVRVLATWNRRPPPRPLDVPPNARLVEWVSYARTMPRCDLVLCHGGHGTMVRALSEGSRVVVAPVSGDMNENAARADWAGVGVRLPWRLLSLQ